MRYVAVAEDHVPVLGIDQMGYSSNPTETRWGPGTRNQYIIHYVISGTGYFQGRRVQSGEGFLITPGMQEVYGPDTNDPWSFLWIISSDSRMASMFPCFHANAETGIFRYNFVPYMRRLAETLKLESPSVISGAALLERFMGIVRHHDRPSSAAEPSSAALRYVNFAARYIEGNYQQPLSIAHLTTLLGVSQPYLCRIFKEEKGVSPRQYLTQCRLTQAKRLLTETDLPIFQIAFSVGFDNALTFTRFFTAHEGYAPTSYRLETK